MDSKDTTLILKKTVAVIPAFNEGSSLGFVLDNLALSGITRAVVGLDPHTTDNSVALLKARGTPYIVAPRTGYDSAVSAALIATDKHYPECEYILFSDAGNKYEYAVIGRFAEALLAGADMVLGYRTNAVTHMRLHQRLGTLLVLFPLRWYFGTQLHDLGPIRMARRSLFDKLDMQPRNFRWPTESLIKALALRAKVVEVPMTLTPRIGISKVSGSLRRSLQAGLEMYSAFQFLRYIIPVYAKTPRT